MLHWRRGDQLRLRCSPETHTKFLVPDFSLNCADVETFIRNATVEIQRHVGNKKILVYVSTHQNTAEEIAKIEEAGFKLYQDIEKDLVKAGVTNEIEVFLTEMGLMCDADYFFGWGRTSANYVVPNCRKYRNKSENSHFLLQNSKGS